MLPLLSGAHLLLASPGLIEGADAFLGGKDSPQRTGTAEEAPGGGTLPRQDPGLGSCSGSNRPLSPLSRSLLASPGQILQPHDPSHPWPS